MVNTKDSKKVLFRLKGGMKSAFLIALIKQNVGAQHVFEALVERVIEFNSGTDGLQPFEKKHLESIFSRARELQADSKP